MRKSTFFHLKHISAGTLSYKRNGLRNSSIKHLHFNLKNKFKITYGVTEDVTCIRGTFGETDVSCIYINSLKEFDASNKLCKVKTNIVSKRSKNT